MNTITRGAVEFVSGLCFEKLPGDVRTVAKTCILDCLGVTLAGLEAPASQRVIRLARGTRGSPSGRILGGGWRVALPMAALANGTMSHVLDYDDDDSLLMVGHPSAPVVSALISLTDMMKVTGKQFIEACVAGVELEMRIGAGINPEHYDHGWHATGTLGALGAAGACAKLLNLGPEQTAHALGIAASEASGLRKNFGTMTKPLHVGLAAQSGLLAALLAADGFTADPAILDGKLGYATVFGNPSEERLRREMAALGEAYAMARPGIAIKRYPCCSGTHTAVDAMLTLRAEHQITPNEIERIECGVGPRTDEVLLYSRPRTGLEGKFSMEYCLAVAALAGKVEIKDFTDERLKQPEIQDLLTRVSMFIDPEIQRGSYGVARRSRIRIFLHDGRILEGDVDLPQGAPEKPLTKEELQEKFLACAQSVLPRPRATSAFRALWRLEDALDVSRIVDGLCDRSARTRVIWRQAKADRSTQRR